MKPVCVSDYREAARRRLPPFLFEYVDGGANDELTLRRNRSDLEDIVLRQRVMRDVSAIDLTTRFFGQAVSMPLALAPIGLGGMMSRRGEVAARRAAHDAGVPFCLSTLSLCSMAEVTAGLDEPIWFQLYMIRDRAFMADLLGEARRQRCSALMFTVDMSVPGIRYRDHRTGLAGAPGSAGAARRIAQALRHPRWAFDVGIFGRPHCLGNLVPVLGKDSGLDDYFAWMRDNFDPRVTWKDLDWVRARWQGPLIIKGILDVEDARQAAKLGVDGIVVSNHGGRQLDGVSSTARALPGIADAVGDRLTVLADGGIRSGLDVVRMLTLGAKGVLIGRAWVYALAARRQAGVAHVLQLMANEMRVAMALTGTTVARELTRPSTGSR